MSSTKTHINHLVVVVTKYAIIASIILLFFLGVVTHDQDLVRLALIAGLLFKVILWIAEILFPASVIALQEKEDEESEHNLELILQQQTIEEAKAKAEEELARRHENKNKWNQSVGSYYRRKLWINYVVWWEV